MGNRAVITTKENLEGNGIGVYLHWNGGRDSVNAFLTYCKMKGYRSPEKDNYGWARLVQVIANFFGGSLSVGIDDICYLDCQGDNGVYIIKDWKIVDRKYFEGPEQNEYDLTEMLVAIDEAQPVKEQLGVDFLKGKVLKHSEIKIGDVLSFIDWNGEVTKAKVIGIGEDKIINGRNVKGVPYMALYSLDDPSDNGNNYLRDDTEYRKLN